MKKIEAVTLEEAYRIACDELGCSMNELRYEVVQYPSNGIFGLFAKPAVIVATRQTTEHVLRESVPEESADSSTDRVPTERDRHTTDTSGVKHRPSEPALSETAEGSHEKIIDRFFDEDSARQTEETPISTSDLERSLQEEIEAQLKSLMESSCFDIDTVEVDVIDDTAYIFLDGEDAALIIGKEGYRYNALSYLLFNWIHSRYKLFIKLEIAQFLSSQEEMIRHYIQPVIEHVEREGWGRTKPLDGILVQIALEQLREAFPNKYVAIKRQRDGGRYVLINEFNSRRR